MTERVLTKERIQAKIDALQKECLNHIAIDMDRAEIKRLNKKIAFFQYLHNRIVQ
jgi:hypothetical protein